MPSDSQIFPFLWTAGGGEYLGADLPGDLNGRQSHAAGSRMNEHPLARLYPRQMSQCVLDGEEANRNSRRLFEAQMLRFCRNEIGKRRYVAGKTGRGQPDHRIADLEVFHARSDGGNFAGAFAA